MQLLTTNKNFLKVTTNKYFLKVTTNKNFLKGFVQLEQRNNNVIIITKMNQRIDKTISYTLESYSEIYSLEFFQED